MLTIFTECGDAVEAAKALATYDNRPHEVWRIGDRFTHYPEGNASQRQMMMNLATKEGLQPRPVATYDPDGTEHC